MMKRTTHSTSTLLLRMLTFLLAALMLGAAFTGCASARPQQTIPSAPTAAETQGAAPEASAEPTQNTEAPTAPAEETTAPTVPAQEPLSLSTTGGAVIVGIIGRDDQGWFLAPEQPLNIEYQYFYEPSRFSDVTKIRLFDTKDDGVEKSIYHGQLITAEGSFSFYRDDFETLYFVPYKILLGKTVAQSYSDPDLQFHDEPADLYDPSLPLPKYTLPLIVDGHYEYNAFMLSKETLSYFGNDFAFFYIDFVDAILNYAPQCHFPNDDFAELLSSVIFYEIPIYSLTCEDFEYSKHYDPETQTITFPYKYDAETHQALLDNFLAEADAMLAQVTPEQTELEKAMAIYHALCTSVTYDYSALEDRDKTQTHNAFVNKSGVCITFANAYNILLNQVGIEARLASGDTITPEPHGWSLVTIDGQKYFCDPTFELNYDGGAGYRFFGMNYEKRLKTGIAETGIFDGRYYSKLLDPSSVAAESLNVG